MTTSASTMATVTTYALEPHGTGMPMRDWLVNDPDYTFSDDYEASVWYQNFTALQLGENDRNNVLRIAISQLGYHEGDSAEDFGGMNATGTANFTEYARLLVPHYNDNSYDWCACFVNWCLNQARFDKASSEISCGNWVNELKSMGMWQASAATGGTYIPKPADFIFFDWDEIAKWPDHIGFVLYVTDTEVYTIEGNTKADNVGIRSYPLNDKRILGYGTPPYEEGDEPTMDFSYSDGMPAGIYVVSEADVSLTDRDGQNPSDTVPVGTAVTFLDETENFIHVSYDGRAGYLPKNSVCLMAQSFSLTYDAGNGKNPPLGSTAHQAIPFTLSQKTPSLQGDTFLGWSTVPYDYKVDYKAGDTIALNQDTVLYAVWENHSKTLAVQAFAQGLAPEFERPTIIQNSGALLLNTLRSVQGLFSEYTATHLASVEDDTDGTVPSFTCDGEGAASHAVLAYGDLCDRLNLKPVSGENAAYVVLRVKEIKGGGLSLKLNLNQQAETASLSLESHDQWQYAVFDLTQSQFTGDLKTLRLDWEGAAGAAESKLLLSEVWIAPNAAVKDAILDGQYVYPAQEKMTTETPSTPNKGESQGGIDSGADDLDFSDGSGSDPSTETNPSSGTQTQNNGTQAPPSDGGCHAAVGVALGGWTACLMGALIVLKKRKE